MDRTEITSFLSDLLIKDRLTGIGKHWAREVSLDYGTKDVRRVDFMQFEPQNVTSISGIEKGIFVCYEVKSCKEDFRSGHGKNFVGEKNYLVTTMQTYKDIINEIPHKVGVLVAIPDYVEIMDEFENPTPLERERNWKLKSIRKAYPMERKRSMAELLFCMLRSGQ